MPLPSPPYRRLYPPLRESARVYGVFHLSASLASITWYHCLSWHYFVHTYPQPLFCWWCGQYALFLPFHCLWGKSPLFLHFFIKDTYCYKKDDQMLSLHTRFTRIGQNCSLGGVLVGEDIAQLCSQCWGQSHVALGAQVRKDLWLYQVAGQGE